MDLSDKCNDPSMLSTFRGSLIAYLGLILIGLNINKHPQTSFCDQLGDDARLKQ